MTWERAALSDFMGDRVVYRNLEPADPAIPGLRALWRRAGLEDCHVPRKTTPGYARVLLLCLERAQALRGIRAPLRRALFIGDTLMNDGTAARNVGAHLPTRCFIGADRLAEPEVVEIRGDLMVANRWAALGEFRCWLAREGVPCDEGTVLLIDLDKTSLGARGRNDRVIDDARVRAMLRTLRGALGEAFDEDAFREVYDRLNRPAYHPFTADNQDYLAYITLLANAGIYPAEDLWRDLDSGALTEIGQFVAACEKGRGRMGPGLRAAHDEVRRGIVAGDPTPFKAFRRDEYRETVSAMDVLGDDAPPADVLRREIVITAEAASLASALAEEGAMVFGISDKPDEASTPPAGADARLLPIHRATMKVYGTPIA